MTVVTYGDDESKEKLCILYACVLKVYSQKNGIYTPNTNIIISILTIIQTQTIFRRALVHYNRIYIILQSFITSILGGLMELLSLNKHLIFTFVQCAKTLCNPCGRFYVF